MKQKSSIFWWFGRRKNKEDKTPLFKDQNVKNKVITSSPIKEKEEEKKEISTHDIGINNEKEKLKLDKVNIKTKVKKEDILKKIEPKVPVITREPDPLINSRIEIKPPQEKAIKQDEEKTVSPIHEENKNIVQASTLDEIEMMLKRNWYQLENIKYELDIIKMQEDKENDTKEVEILLEKLNQLIKKLEEIKKDFYNKNFEEIYINHNSDIYIAHLINEYKEAIKSDNKNNSSLLKIKQIEEYINIIDEIINVEIETDKLNNSLEDKKEELNIRDDEFEDLKENYHNIEKEEKYITSFLKEQQYIIKDIEEKIKNSTNITKTVEYKTELVTNYTKLLTATLLLATTNIFPPTRKGNILKTGLMVGAIINLAGVVKPRIKENKTITKVTYTDYSQEIMMQMNSLDNVTLSLNQALENIKDLKSWFAKEFNEYVKVIPEFNDMMLKLDSIEKELIIKNDIIKNYNQKLNNTLNKNNVKVKSLTEEH